MAMSLAWLSPCTTISPYKFSCCSAISCQADLPTTTATAIRPALILPGLGNNTNDNEKLAQILKGYGVPTAIAKVSRIDWMRNGAGLLDTNYWRGTLRPHPVLDWPPPKGLPGVIDQTRGLLYYVEENCAKAVYSPELRYVCIAGRFVAGQMSGVGVVPEVSAHMKGALNVTLEGVYHSPVGSDDATRPWYGSPAVVKQWIRHLLV
ncbi:unnamed protein product [Withania somnifera]